METVRIPDMVKMEWRQASGLERRESDVPPLHAIATGLDKGVVFEKPAPRRRPRHLRPGHRPGHHRPAAANRLVQHQVREAKRLDRVRQPAPRLPTLPGDILLEDNPARAGESDGAYQGNTARLGSSGVCGAVTPPASPAALADAAARP